MLIISRRCKCNVCEAERRIDRLFESRIIRIGRRYGTTNKKMLRPKIAVWKDYEKGELVYVRLPYDTGY